jgi:hypothetical protein
MSTESSVPVTTTGVTTTSTPDITTTVVTTPLTEQEKMDLYNKYKAELKDVEFYANKGQVMSLITGLLFLASFLLWTYPIDEHTHKLFRYGVLVWLLLLFISLIASSTMCFIAIGKKVFTTEYRDNYQSMYKNAANTKELIDLYEELVGKKTKKCEDCYGPNNNRTCEPIPCEDKFKVSSSYTKTTTGAILSLIIALLIGPFAGTWYNNRVS